jgi:SAM-dependent methyltransferase
MSEKHSPVYELPQYAASKNEETAEVYFEDLGLTMKDVQGKNILDIGAGEARFAQAMQTEGVHVTSVDLRPEWHTSIGITPTNVEYHIADARQRLPFADEQFDLIVSRAAVHSMVDTREDFDNVIREAKRLLKPDGEFRFGPGSSKFRELSESEEERLEGLFIRHDIKHEQLTTQEKQELELLAAKADYQDEKDNTAKTLRILPEPQRTEKLRHLWLEELQRSEPNITLRPGNQARDDYGGDYYFVVKKSKHDNA